MMTVGITVAGNPNFQKVELKCSLCGCTSMRKMFTELDRGTSYSSYYCSNCDLYQTIGDVSAVSPDYVVLKESDLSTDHVWLQTDHKRRAFQQWWSLMKRHTATVISGNARSVLDVGCGVGGFLDYAVSQGVRAYGFDASQAQARRARQYHESVRCCIDVNEYISEFSLKHRVDYVTMWDVFEHIREPNQTLSGLRECLTRTGLLFISTPNGAVTILKIMLARLLGKAPGLIPWEHVFYYSKRSLRIVLENNGFHVKEIGGVALYHRPLSAHEITRRIVCHSLMYSPYALQIYAIASAQPD